MKRLVIISVITKAWDEGTHVWFDLRLSHGTSAVVNWGGGAQSTCTQYDNGVWRRVEHRYGCKGMARPFQIEIWADDENGLMGIIDGAWEMTTESVVIENAPGLISLAYHNAKAFDFCGCPNLRELECDSYRQEFIDLGPLKGLQRLQCRYSSLS